MALNSTLFTFDAELKAYAEVLDAKIEAVLKLIVLDIYNRLIDANPVDTGHSQANWRIALDEPDDAIRNGASGKQPPNLTEFPAGRDIFVTNPVDYVQWLNEGTSKQAPAGFIQIALAQVEAKVDSYVQQARASGFKG